MKEEIPWTTRCELNFLDVLENSRVFGLIKPSNEVRIKAIKTWLRHSETRDWPKNLDVKACVIHANGCLARLGG